MEITFKILQRLGSNLTAFYQVDSLVYMGIQDGTILTYNTITGRIIKYGEVTGHITGFLLSSGTLYATGNDGDSTGTLYSLSGGTFTTVTTHSAVLNCIIERSGVIYIGTAGGEVYTLVSGSLVVSLNSATSGVNAIRVFYLFGNDLYAGTQELNALKVWKFTGSWSLDLNVALTGSILVYDIKQFNSRLYVTYTEGIYRKTGSSWAKVYTSSGNARGMAIIYEKLYVVIQSGSSAGYALFNVDNKALLGEFEEATILRTDDGENYDTFYTQGDLGTERFLFLLKVPCSDELFISKASPFNWDLGVCEIEDYSDIIEEGCHCDIVKYGETIPIEVESIGTPGGVVRNEDDDIIKGFSFSNVSGNIYRASLLFDSIGKRTLEIYIPSDDCNEDAAVSYEENTVLPNATFSAFDSAYHAGSGYFYVCGFTATPAQGILYRTKDLITWEQVLTETGQLQCIAIEGDIIAINSNVATSFVISEDGGDTWITSRDSGVAGNGIDIKNGVIVICGTLERVYYSDDYGVSWNDIDPGSTKTLRAVFMLSDTYFFVAGDDGTAYMTPNQGADWSPLNLHTSTTDYYDIFFINEEIGFIVGGSTILKTEDGGYTFYDTHSGSTETYRSILFVNDCVGFAWGTSGRLKVSYDVGETWEENGTHPLFPINISGRGSFKLETVFAKVLIPSQSASGRTETATVLFSPLPEASSKCINVRHSFDRSVLVEYTNDKNFVGLQYSDGHINKIRIPGIFWKPVTPQEKSEYVTTTGQTITPVQSTRNQMELQTDLLPEYVHKKLRLIFMHSGIRINDKNYIASGNYEYDLQDDFRMAHGRVTLTEQGYLEENILT